MPKIKRIHIWREGMKTFCGRHVTTVPIVTRAQHEHATCYHCTFAASVEGKKA